MIDPGVPLGLLTVEQITDLNEFLSRARLHSIVRIRMDVNDLPYVYLVLSDRDQYERVVHALAEWMKRNLVCVYHAEELRYISYGIWACGNGAHTVQLGTPLPLDEGALGEYLPPPIVHVDEPDRVERMRRIGKALRHGFGEEWLSNRRAGTAGYGLP